MKSKYSIIKSSFFDEHNKVWCIDAWLGEEPEEEGKVIAEVSLDGTVKYNDIEAITDIKAQEVIKEKVFRCICYKVAVEMTLNFETDYMTSNFESEAYIPYLVCEAQLFKDKVYLIYESQTGNLVTDTLGNCYCSTDSSEILKIADKLNGFSNEKEREKNIEELKLDWIHSFKDIFSYKVFEYLNKSSNLEEVSEKCFEYLLNRVF